MSKETAITFAAVALASALGLLGGCTGGCSQEPEAAQPAPSAVQTRMQDPAYVAKLDQQRQEMYAAMDVMAKAQEALNAAKASEAPAEEIARLEAALKAAEDALVTNQKKSQAIVRDQIHKALAEDQAQQNFKGETRKGN